jgi:hypothetical protein
MRKLGKMIPTFNSKAKIWITPAFQSDLWQDRYLTLSKTSASIMLVVVFTDLMLLDPSKSYFLPLRTKTKQFASVIL